MWFKSASKLVFIGITVTLCAAFLFEVFKGSVTLDPKDFLGLAGMAFAFYFTRDKGETPITQQTTTIVPPQGQDAA